MLNYDVRLNNKFVFLVARSNITINQLYKTYSIKFDKNKDLRSRRVLLESLAKQFFDVNVVNLDDCILKFN